MKLTFNFLIFFIISVNSIHAQDTQESMMSSIDNTYLEKLIAAAKMNYPKMKTNQAIVNIAKMNVQKAKLDWLNIVNFNYLYSPNNTTTLLVNTSLLNGYQIGVGTSIGSILQKPVNVKTAKKEYDIAQLNLDEYNLAIEAIVKQRYYAYIQQQVVLHWKMKNLEGADNTMKEIKYKFEKGLEIFDNYNKALASYSASVQAKIESEGAYLVAKSSLEEIIGVKLESIQ